MGNMISPEMQDEVFRRCDEVRPALRARFEQNRWWRGLSPEEKTDPLTLALRLTYQKKAGDPIDHLLHVFRGCAGLIPYVSICNRSLFVVGGLRSLNSRPLIWEIARRTTGMMGGHSCQAFVPDPMGLTNEEEGTYDVLTGEKFWPKLVITRTKFTEMDRGEFRGVSRETFIDGCTD